MGVPTYNITSAVNLVIAQRLMRRLHKCKQPDDMPKEALLQAGFNEDEIEDLRNRIRTHDKKYYVEAAPEISDREYDQLINRLKQLESKHP